MQILVLIKHIPHIKGNSDTVRFGFAKYAIEYRSGMADLMPC